MKPSYKLTIWHVHRMAVSVNSQSL